MCDKQANPQREKWTIDNKLTLLIFILSALQWAGCTPQNMTKHSAPTQVVTQIAPSPMVSPVPAKEPKPEGYKTVKVTRYKKEYVKTTETENYIVDK